MTEIVFSAAHPDHAWVGDETGRVYRGGAAGSDWTALPDGAFTEVRGAVQAIAVHPVNEETVYVGTYSEIPVAAEPGFLYRTDDNGANWRHIGADVKDATGKLVGVRALELDPDHPDTMWAATDVGVWRSTDAGDHWQPFNEGLPNCRVVDLAFEPATRTLRCGAWGRGVFERHVGDRPPKDVVLALRANAVDPGGVRPALAGPDALALTPTAAVDSASPDIMNRRALPTTGFLIDGSELDALDGEDAVPGATNVLVQVHNRGSFPTTGVQVIALWAFADAGPPDFPDGFWSDLFSGAGLAVGTTKGEWTVLGTTKLGDPPSPPTAKHDTLAPGDPRASCASTTPGPTRCATTPASASWRWSRARTTRSTRGRPSRSTTSSDSSPRRRTASCGRCPSTRTPTSCCGRPARPDPDGRARDRLPDRRRARPPEHRAGGRDPGGQRGAVRARRRRRGQPVGDPRAGQPDRHGDLRRQRAAHRQHRPRQLRRGGRGREPHPRHDEPAGPRAVGRVPAGAAQRAVPAGPGPGPRERAGVGGGDDARPARGHHRRRAEHRFPAPRAVEPGRSDAALHRRLRADRVVRRERGDRDHEPRRARAFEVRAAINRQLQIAERPGRAEGRRVELAVRRSISEIAGARCASGVASWPTSSPRRTCRRGRPDRGVQLAASTATTRSRRRSPTTSTCGSRTPATSRSPVHVCVCSASTSPPADPTQ